MSLNHLSETVDHGVSLWPNKPVLKYRNDETGQWISITWNEFKNQVDQCANALAAMGVAEEENVGVFSQNMPQSFVLDYANYYNRAVTVPLYATSSQYQVQYIVNDAEIKLIFVGEQYQYDTVFSVLSLCHTLQRIVIYDRKVVKHEHDTISLYFDDFMQQGAGLPQNELVASRRAKATADDLMCLLYTSGTTGESKGVMLPHSCLIAQFDKHFERLGSAMQPGDVSMDFLPLTHVFERAWSHLCLYYGITIAVNRDPQNILTTIKEVHPTHMCCVPRFWEKVYIAVQQKMAESSPMVRSLMQDAIKVGKQHNIDYLRLGKKPPLWLRMKYKLYERTVYSALRKQVGLENAKFFPTAGAAVSDEVCQFVHSVGINMIVGYGLTESTATVSCFPLSHWVLGSVGEVLDDLDVKIGADDEVLLRGKSIMRGYYHKPDETAKAFDADGFFHTGDTGRLEGRVLYLHERLKDLMKTSNGKYISPQAIEARLVIDRYIDQVAIIADGRKFVSALIVPNYKNLITFAQSKGLDTTDVSALIVHPDVVGMYQDRIDTLQQEFAHFEQIKRFTLLPKPFSMQDGEMTNTLKLRRRVVAEHYKDIIDNMYGGDNLHDHH